MSASFELSEEEQAAAIQFIKQKRKDRDYKIKKVKEAEKKYDLIIKFFGLKEEDSVNIVYQIFKNTLIHTYSTYFNISRSGEKQIYEDYRSVAGTYISYSYRGLVSDHYRKESLDDVNDHSDNVYFINPYYICPFCGDAHQKAGLDHYEKGYFETPEYLIRKHLDEDSSLEDFQSTLQKLNPSDFTKQAAKLKRCHHHENTTRKEFLQNWETNSRYGNDDLEKKKLLEDIYPPAIKYTKAYFVEKRIKKVCRKRPLTKSEIEFFQMIVGVSKIKQMTK